MAVSGRAVAATAQAARVALGWVNDDDGDVYSAAALGWGLVEGYTRGRGCPVDLVAATDPPTEAELAAIAAAATPPADLAAVALAATLRLAANPAQRVSETTTTEGHTHRVEGAFSGFTLAEQLVLNRYRVRVR